MFLLEKNRDPTEMFDDFVFFSLEILTNKKWFMFRMVNFC